MTERIENAIELCGKIEYSVNEKNYSDLNNACGLFQMTAEQELKNGKTENEVLTSLGEAIKETTDLYLEVQKGNAEEPYEKNVYANTFFYFEVENNSLTLYMECSEYQNEILDGYDIIMNLDYALDEARDEYEAESEYDD